MNRQKQLLIMGAMAGGGMGLLIGGVGLSHLLSTPLSPLSILLCAALGAVAGAAILPFSEDRTQLAWHSLLHFVLTAALFALLVWQLGAKGLNILLWVGLLTLLYLLIWLVRWIGWYLEVVELRKLLGLSSGPTPLKWRETLPYLPFAVLMCNGLPLLLRGVEMATHVDIPILTGLFLPYLLLPVISLCAGLSLGKRQGLCPLFPAACFICYLPMVYLLYNDSALFHCFMTAVPALAGNLLGWLRRGSSSAAP